MIEMHQALAAVSMSNKDDPARMFKALSNIQNQYTTPNFQVSKEGLIATVLDKAPKKYGTVLTCVMRVQGAPLSLSYLQKAMNQVWHTLFMWQETEGKEMLLTTQDTVDRASMQLLLAQFSGT